MCTRFIFFLVFFYALSGMSQRTEIYNEKIKTIRMCVGKDSGMLPVLRLNSNDKLEVSFDELSHDYHRDYMPISVQRICLFPIMSGVSLTKNSLKIIRRA